MGASILRTTADIYEWHPSHKPQLRIAGKIFTAHKYDKIVTAVKEQSIEPITEGIQFPDMRLDMRFCHVPTWSGFWQERALLELCDDQEVRDIIIAQKCIRRLKGEQV